MAVQVNNNNFIQPVDVLVVSAVVLVQSGAMDLLSDAISG
jgi:hypothetical protein